MRIFIFLIRVNVLISVVTYDRCLTCNLLLNLQNTFLYLFTKNFLLSLTAILKHHSVVDLEEVEEVVDVVVILEARGKPENATIVTKLGTSPKIAPKKIINF